MERKDNPDDDGHSGARYHSSMMGTPMLFGLARLGVRHIVRPGPPRIHP